MAAALTIDAQSTRHSRTYHALGGQGREFRIRH
jgi:hypothetical protein